MNLRLALQSAQLFAGWILCGRLDKRQRLAAEGDQHWLTRPLHFLERGNTLGLEFRHDHGLHMRNLNQVR